ncbi:MAG: Arc family DNA-binding protein [Thiothrix sp.]|nr:MAG: Arc family DNA-binding protein [Thiothrix sp.]
MAGQQQTPYPLRLAPDLRDTLEAIAKDNGRSLNAEITLRLEESIAGKVQAQVEPAYRDLISLIGEQVRQIVREELRATKGRE